MVLVETRPVAEAQVACSDVCVSVGGRTLFADVSFQVAAGRMLGVLGPSGCGKSTLLRVVSMLQRADSGTLLLGRRRLDLATDKPPPGFYPQLTLMQQTFPLFPGMPTSVALQIIGAGAEFAGALAMQLKVSHLLDRLPDELSVGQRQRMAFIRALSLRPRVLLLDEPTSALDEKSSAQVLDEVRRYLDAEQASAILVTHDRRKARSYCDNVLEMGEG